MSSWLKSRRPLHADYESLKNSNAVSLTAGALQPLIPEAEEVEEARNYRHGTSFQGVQPEHGTVIVRPAATLQQSKLNPRKKG